MKRNCNNCKKKEGQPEYNACGYLPESVRKPTKSTVKGFDYISDVCPVYTYLENLEIYECINLYRNFNNIPSLNFKERLIIDTYNKFMIANKEE